MPYKELAIPGDIEREAGGEAMKTRTIRAFPKGVLPCSEQRAVISDQ